MPTSLMRARTPLILRLFMERMHLCLIDISVSDFPPAYWQIVKLQIVALKDQFHVCISAM